MGGIALMERGYFHTSRGYWQTTNEPPKHILDGYPEGTVEVPVKPSAAHEWDGSEWAEVTPDPAKVLAQERRDALAYLASTDWMVTRMADTGKPIPDDVAKARAEARGKASR